MAELKAARTLLAKHIAALEDQQNRERFDAFVKGLIDPRHLLHPSHLASAVKGLYLYSLKEWWYGPLSNPMQTTVKVGDRFTVYQLEPRARRLWLIHGVTGGHYYRDQINAMYDEGSLFCLNAADFALGDPAYSLEPPAKEATA
jgi:hypothetical protein